MKATKLTKKEFKELVNYVCYTNRSQKFHAFYYDYKQGIYGENKGGYKYCYVTTNRTKTEFFNDLYDHIFNSIDNSLYMYTRIDENRFKVSLSLNLNLFN